MARSLSLSDVAVLSRISFARSLSSVASCRRRPRPESIRSALIGTAGASRRASQAFQMKSLRARQPKDLLQSDVFTSTPPDDLEPQALEDLAKPETMTDPAKVLNVYRQYLAHGDRPTAAVSMRAFVQLGFLFDPNSFFSTADKQRLTSHDHFRNVAYDLAQAKNDIPDAAAPVLLYAMTCLEYRCVPVLPTLLDAVERNLSQWRTEVLSLILHSLVSLGLAGGNGSEAEVFFAIGNGNSSRDYGHLCSRIAGELGRRALIPSGLAEGGGEASLHDWSRAAFSLAMANLYDAPSSCGGLALPAILAKTCEDINKRDVLDNSGWAQFFIYQTLYGADVEHPANEIEIKRSVPMWIQERLHDRWLDSIVLQAQPQGADDLQRDVDMALKRTNTQALINCSAGREWDEQHCWFAGFLLQPRVSIECDGLMPLGPGRPRQSGLLSMKSRILKKMGFTVVTIHRCFWERLSDDQKDEQVLRLRSHVGYVHDQELEKKLRRPRQTAHTYKGIESKKSDWRPETPSLS
eukprot:TRINITY_DN20397_c0_g1_i1.p1 TRINITY_DN20397_c0_g1~~TRINITY_DN20397_c0_g1_i1.p1  ORF type:complete len:576 (-),score=100.80 TRINITY_DN20397_c0_g1_i1:185-1747(-)